MNAPENTALKNYAHQFEQLGKKLGLEYYPIDFELVPDNFMMEIAVYGLPVRMPHWSFGLRYIHQLIRQSMGHSRIFEVMFPGDPCHAYLVEHNSISENALVVAHVIGHADFVKNNHLFARLMQMAGGQILAQAAKHAHSIEEALTQFGQERVEAVLDAALALEPHIDVHQDLHRPPLPEISHASEPATEENQFAIRFHQLPGEASLQKSAALPMSARFPAAPEHDLLWFIAHFAPDMQPWERDIFLAVREESFYFYPVFACQIMNEGWASYWHARLLREADFLPQDMFVSAIKSHSDVVRPYAADDQYSLAINPYHLGFSIWEELIAQRGIDVARQVCKEEDDFGFIRNYLTKELAEKLNLFVFEAHEHGEIRLAARDIHAVQEAILAPKFNYGAPQIAVTQMEQDGSLRLAHNYQSDGRGLELERAHRVLEYVAKCWRRPVIMETVDANGKVRSISR